MEEAGRFRKKLHEHWFVQYLDQIMLGWLVTRLLVVPLLCVYTVVASAQVTYQSFSGLCADSPQRHEDARQRFLTVSLTWNTPFVKYSVYIWLYFYFIYSVTAFATGNRSVVDWPGLTVYAFGAGLLGAEMTQVYNGYIHTDGLLKELLSHFDSFWRSVDVCIIVLVCTCAIQRLPLVRTGDHTSDSLGDVSLGDEMDWSVDDAQTGQAVVSLLCIVAWARVLGLFIIDSKIGPLVQMVLEMRRDLYDFSVLTVIFVLGLGIAEESLLAEDRSSSVSTLGGALYETFQGVLGNQDMDQLTTGWESEAVYTVYLVVAQVLLMNLLTAMFASTYERINVSATDEWRLATAKIFFSEYSNDVRGISELPLLNLLALCAAPLGWLWLNGMRNNWCLGPARMSSRVRLPWEELQAPRFVLVETKRVAQIAAEREVLQVQRQATLGSQAASQERDVNLVAIDTTVCICAG